MFREEVYGRFQAPQIRALRLSFFDVADFARHFPHSNPWFIESLMSMTLKALQATNHRLAPSSTGS